MPNLRKGSKGGFESGILPLSYRAPQKSFKRGVAYHTMMSVAIMMMKFESILGDLPLGPVRLQCRQLTEALHLRDPDMVNIYEDLVCAGQQVTG